LYNGTSVDREVITMMDSVTVGAKIRLTENDSSGYPVGAVATILYIDDLDNVFVEWTDGKLTSFPENQLRKRFEKTDKA
jgi:hypothetical protein